MPVVVGISLRTAGKIYFFDPGTTHIYAGQRVLVETSRGPELGTVKLPPHEVSDAQIVSPLKGVLREATAADLARDTVNREREQTALETCRRHVERLNLPMRLIDAQFTFDGGHVLIHFLAENRVDFRELVRDLARELHARIELRQVGVRDEAKLLGGVGMCGRGLCCASFLNNFAPVAINMAKVQGLALNPQKISGACGRLMCCLAFEYEHYRDLRVGLPKLNATIDTPRGTGKVTKLNLIARQVEVTIPELSEPVWFTAEELNGEPAPCGGCARCAEHEAEVSDDEPAVEEAQGDEAAVRRNRRRRRKPTPENAAPAQPSAPSTPPAPPAEGAPRQRRRRPRPAPADGQPAPPPNPDGQPRPMPQGRYRPRRRRE
jgi:cell fate regulator YaaT (PSP1 superfamily)